MPPFCFWDFWIIFPIITLNSFSGRFPISTSLSSSEILSCSFGGIYFSAVSFCLTFYVCCLRFWGCRFVVLLASGACPLVGGTGSCPSGWQPISRAVFRGGSALSTTLGSLSAGGWSCVPTLLVVWPEMSQHWSLQVVGWGKVFVQKWPPPGEITLISVSCSLSHQCPCPHCEPQLTPTSPGDPPRPAGWSGPGFYGVTTLPRVPCTWNLVCALQELSFCFPQSCAAPALQPHWLSKPNGLESPPPDARPPGRVVCCGTQNSHSYGRTSKT